jgi:hypothetical protein
MLLAETVPVVIVDHNASELYVMMQLYNNVLQGVNVLNRRMFGAGIFATLGSLFLRDKKTKGEIHDRTDPVYRYCSLCGGTHILTRIEWEYRCAKCDYRSITNEYVAQHQYPAVKMIVDQR